jgi:hypothetical protein
VEQAFQRGLGVRVNFIHLEMTVRVFRPLGNRNEHRLPT